MIRSFYMLCIALFAACAAPVEPAEAGYWRDGAGGGSGTTVTAWTALAAGDLTLLADTQSLVQSGPTDNTGRIEWQIQNTSGLPCTYLTRTAIYAIDESLLVGLDHTAAFQGIEARINFEGAGLPTEHYLGIGILRDSTTNGYAQVAYSNSLGRYQGSRVTGTTLAGDNVGVNTVLANTEDAYIEVTWVNDTTATQQRLAGRLIWPQDKTASGAAADAGTNNTTWGAGVSKAVLVIGHPSTTNYGSQLVGGTIEIRLKQMETD